MTINPKDRIEDIDARLKELPKGTLTYKTINGKKQPYVQKSVDGKVTSTYVKLDEREQVLLEFAERTKLQEEKKHLIAYMQKLQGILSRNPYLDASVGIGFQNFGDYACGKQFYVDKTHFISEWLRSNTALTLINRPRRFGKTMLLSTVEHFFDPRFAGQPENFKKLRVWKDEKSRALFGKIPVISVSFGSCKGMNYKQAMQGMAVNLRNMYEAHRYLEESTELRAEDKAEYRRMRLAFQSGNTEEAGISIQVLCDLLYRHHHTKPIILLDEYDTPLLEAYTDGYWDEMIATCRQLFHCTFKENPFLNRAIITGVTKISRNSLFSDVNNLKTCTVTSDDYSDCFGFTEQEVMDALKCQNIDAMQDVKAMYDGFIIGNRKDIYNPWSICNYMQQRQLQSYWVNTSSNKLIGEMIRRHPLRSKHEIEELMRGEPVHKRINENITFQYLDGDENSLWSLLLSVGYIKADHVVKDRDITVCDVSVTNEEVMGMFQTEIMGMFHNGMSICNEFAQALVNHKIEDLNDILLDLSYDSMRYFDTGGGPAERVPENFYHGLVLGLIVCLREEYRIVSNRESGRGRYDIVMYPRQTERDAFILEFKVRNEKLENNLEETADNALKQIEDRAYEKDLLAAGIPAEHIYKVGFAFSGKDVLVKEKNKRAEIVKNREKQ
ncbi:AAA family ATPase [Clostridium sp. OM02-18AC]|uniref:AAA family ATPase n=1 Tax=Clostridium sp. OM02-18AC TaxID=2292311 RepID=UPI001FAAE22C|nr:AAA family ATPase [Clostridium sp. OM02-18AC]